MADDSNTHSHAGRLECCWQRTQLPDAIREFVLRNPSQSRHTVGSLWSEYHQSCIAG